MEHCDDVASSSSDEPSPPLSKWLKNTNTACHPFRAARRNDETTPWLVRTVLALLIAGCGTIMPAQGQPGGPAWPRVTESGVLRFGSDEEGGAPFLFRDDNEQLVGFELDLLTAVGRELGGITPEFRQGGWDTLLQLLERGDVDVVVNGYEKTPSRESRYLSTRPYYVYQLQLLALKGGIVRSWADLKFAKPDGGRWRVGVLGGSGAEQYARANSDPSLVEVVYFEGTTNALMATVNGQVDCTLQDLAPSRFYLGRPEYQKLAAAGPPEGCGYYVMYVRIDDIELRDRLDRAIGKLIASGELRKIYETWNVWNEAQETLATFEATSVDQVRPKRGLDFGRLIVYGPTLLAAAGMTIFLACAAMPLAILAGMVIALGRVYGPKPLDWLLRGYVEVIRGTPLMLQLFFLFYLMPELGVYLPAIAAGVLGLAINYSAYEAEIYRAGLQAIPRGQLEAARALGMTLFQAIRRVVLPQTVRIVVPPVTNDFIAMFKDTSVCSVITLVELTKQYSILSNSQGGVVEFGLAAGAIYLAMSLPLAWFSTWFERRLDGHKPDDDEPDSTTPPANVNTRDHDQNDLRS